MALTKKQQELDVIKWKKSEELGEDACGTFDYCEKCDKALENPCDKAYKKLHAKPKAPKSSKKAVKTEPKVTKAASKTTNKNQAAR